MITQEANLTPAAFYLYFKSKLDIYRLLTLEGTDILESMYKMSLSATHQDNASKIKALAKAHFNFFIKYREYYNIISILHLGQPDFFTDSSLVQMLEDRAVALLKLLKAILEEGIRSGEFRKLDTWKTAAVLWGCMDGNLLLDVKGGTGYIGVNAKKLIDQLVDLIIIGLKSR